jgi:hypothetical protein
MFCSPVVLCLLNCITDTVQVTEGRKYFPQGPHFVQSWPIHYTVSAVAYRVSVTQSWSTVGNQNGVRHYQHWKQSIL